MTSSIASCGGATVASGARSSMHDLGRDVASAAQAAEAVAQDREQPCFQVGTGLVLRL